MSLKENKAIVRNFLDALNTQDLLALDDYVAPNYYDYTNQFQGLDSIKRAITRFYKGFPDFHVTIEDILAEGDKVWVHETEMGTHKGAYHGLDPTGQRITFSCVDIFRIIDGQLTEGWHVYDFLNFYHQLGVIEYTEIGQAFNPESAPSQPTFSSRQNATSVRHPAASLEANKAIIQRLYDADNNNEWTVLDELISPNFQEVALQLHGPAAYKQFTSQFFTGFPDWQETVKDIIAEKENVWAYIKGFGTHTGEFWGVPPSGKMIAIMMVQMWRVKDGKVVEKRSVADELDAYNQSGVIEYTEKGKILFPKRSVGTSPDP